MNETQNSIATPHRPHVEKHALRVLGLRKGMWVKVIRTQMLGVLTGCDREGYAEVTLQKEDGNTQMALSADDKAVPARVYCKVEDIRQAYINEIPEPRRPSLDSLLALGYVEE